MWKPQKYKLFDWLVAVSKLITSFSNLKITQGVPKQRVFLVVPRWRRITSRAGVDRQTARRPRRPQGGHCATLNPSLKLSNPVIIRSVCLAKIKTPVVVDYSYILVFE